MRMNQSKKNKRRAYMEVILAFSIIPLFLTAHYLLTIRYVSHSGTMNWFGVSVDKMFIVDFVLYTAIFLTFILFLLVLHRNFIVRGKRKR